MQSSSPFWVNRDDTRDVIHEGTCTHVVWAIEPKWKRYLTLESARADYPNAHECGCIPAMSEVRVVNANTQIQGKKAGLAVFDALLQRGALPYLPLVDIEGVDAVVSVAGSRLIRIQVKAAGISGGKDPKWFQVQKLEVARDLFVVCVEAPSGVIGDMWIFPSVVFHEYANNPPSGVRDLDLCGGEKKYGQPLWELLCGFRNRWELITEYGDYGDLLSRPQDLEDVLTMKEALESTDDEMMTLEEYERQRKARV